MDDDAPTKAEAQPRKIESAPGEGAPAKSAPAKSATGESAPKKKKKKKRKPIANASGSSRAPVSVPPLPPPPPSSSLSTVVVVCLAGAILGGIFYTAAIKGKGPEQGTAASASASPGGNADPTATPSDVASPPADAKKTPSGLAYRVLKQGDNTNRPTTSDRVRVHYAGWSQDGKLFDSSYTRGQPATFGVTQVIKGWTEGLQLMSVGEKTRFWIPAELAYGEHPGGGKPGGQLTFDVELLEITK